MWYNYYMIEKQLKAHPDRDLASSSVRRKTVLIGRAITPKTEFQRNHRDDSDRYVIINPYIDPYTGEDI